MKIGILTTSFRPYQWYSGISNAVYLLANELHTKHNADITIFVPNYDRSIKKEEHKNFNIERFNIINLDFSGSQYISLEAFKKVYSGNFDIIHSFHYGYFPASVGFRVAKKKCLPHIFTAAYHPPSSIINKNLIKIYNFTHGRSIIKHSDAVILFNKNEVSEISKISKGRFKILPCPINHNIFKPKNTLTDNITIAFVGAMEHWKGPQIAFNIFKQIEKERPNVNFIFVGNGMLKHQVDLYNKLKLASSNRFTFLRNLSPQELCKVYNMADVLVAPTLYESFGCILAESMMCGTPIVSTKVGAVPETVGNGGLINDYGNWNKMKNSIDVLLDDYKLRRRLSRNAIEHSKQYRYDVVTRRVLNIYKKSINNL